MNESNAPWPELPPLDDWADTFATVHMWTSRGHALLGARCTDASRRYFAPAHRLYASHGFVTCPPFGDYEADPNRVFLTRMVDSPSDCPQCGPCSSSPPACRHRR